MRAPVCGAGPVLTDDEFNRLRWQCRRGMLELDVLLSRYLDRAWPMDQGNRQAFRQLLECSDQQLQGWLCDGAVPDKDVAAIVRAILATDSH